MKDKQVLVIFLQEEARLHQQIQLGGETPFA